MHQHKCALRIQEQFLIEDADWSNSCLRHTVRAIRFDLSFDLYACKQTKITNQQHQQLCQINDRSFVIKSNMFKPELNLSNNRL